MNIAIVGCGQIADAHIQESRRIPHAQVVAVCDTDRHMAEQASTRFGIPARYTTLEAMLEEANIDVVHVTTPPQTHLSIAKAAIAKGKHLYIEKPFAVNSQEAEELVDLATRQGVLVCVGHCYAFDPSFVRLKDLVAEGKLGDAVHIDAVMGYNLAGQFGSLMMNEPSHWVHELPGGLVQNNFSHPLSMVMHFIPDEKPVIDARGLRMRQQRFGDCRDNFFDEVRVLMYGRDATASLVFSSASRPVQLNTTVSGTKAQATASIDARSLRITLGASLPGPLFKLQWSRRDFVEARREYRSHIRDLIMARLHYFDGLKELMRLFYLAIDGKSDLPIPMSEAIRATAIMDEIFFQCEQSDVDRA